MSEQKETKACPFCGEEILAVAIKCKHCQTDLKSDDANKTNKINQKIEIVTEPRDEFDLIKSIIKVVVYIGAFILGASFLYGLINGLSGKAGAVSNLEHLSKVTVSQLHQVTPEYLLAVDVDKTMTALQKERVSRDLDGRIIQWTLRVKQIRSGENQNEYIVITTQGQPIKQNEGLAESARDAYGNLLEDVFRFAADMDKKDRSYNKIQAQITLSARNEKEKETISQLKPGDSITVRGYVKKITLGGTLKQGVEIQPAILADSPQHSTASNQSDNNKVPPVGRSAENQEKDKKVIAPEKNYSSSNSTEVSIQNMSNLAILKIYVSAENDRNWGSDVLENQILLPNFQFKINPGSQRGCIYDIAVKYMGEKYEAYRKQNLCKLEKIQFSYQTVTDSLQ